MYTLSKIFMCFIIYSFLGWVYESALYAFKEKRFINRGFLYGPYCPIYGWGSLLVIAVLGKIENPIVLFAAGAVLTCSLEYVSHYILEKVYHKKWWDYSARKFNIKGRVCLLGAVAFGGLSVVLIDAVHPLIEMLIALVPQRPFIALSWAAFGIYLVDNIATFRHLGKGSPTQRERAKALSAETDGEKAIGVETTAVDANGEKASGAQAGDSAQYEIEGNRLRS